MRFVENKKYNIFKIVISSILLFFFFWYFTTIKEYLLKVLGVFQPFIIGGVIAYIIGIPMNFFEAKLRKNFPDKKYNKFITGFSLTISWILVIAFLSLILNILIPRIIAVIFTFLNRWPEFVREIYKFMSDFPLTERYADDFYKSINSITYTEVRNNLINYLSGDTSQILSMTTGFINSVGSSLVSSFTIFFFSIFVLLYKEMLKTNGTRIIYALFEEKRADYIEKVLSLSYNTFKEYLFSRLIAIITLSSMIFIGMLILRIPNAAIISLFVGLADLIPIFGPLFGAGLSAVIIFFESPIKALIFLILNVIIQQIQENVIYPAIAGEKIGLPAIWVLASVTIGGSLFGVWGMLVSIPVASILYSLFHEFIDNKLKDKNITDEIIEYKKNRSYTIGDIDKNETK